MKARKVSAALLVLLLGCSAASAEASTTEDLERAAAAVAAAGREMAQVGEDADRVAAQAAAIRAYEDALVALRNVVIGAGAEERRLILELGTRREEIMRLSAALQRMSRVPAPAQAMHPDGPLAAARAGAIMQAVMPALQAEAEALAQDLEALDTARRLHRTGLANLAAGLAELETARDGLQAGLAAAGTAPFDAAPETLSRDSATLSALAEALDTGGGRATGAEPQVGTLSWPLEGEVVRGFREADGAGVRRPGMLLSAAPLSLVTAPADAIVRYAGPFLDYGYVAVLETDDDALLVLAGLAQIVVRGGATVAKGDLLGLLGGRALNVEEYVMLPVVETVAGARETLYVEIRHGDGPVDPMPWFETENG